MKKGWMSGAMFAAAMVGSGTISQSKARADVYHAVEPGDTLGTVANRYHIGVNALRTANHLETLGDYTALPAMLLRVPEDNAPGAITPIVSNADATPSALGSGSISASATYRVQAGDSVESIAQAYADTGYRVSASSIRTRNHVDGQPAVGTLLVVPLSSSTYRAQPISQERPRPTVRVGTGLITSALPNGASVSEELPLPMASMITPPAFKAPVVATKTLKPKAKAALRTTQRGSVLGARGYFPSPTLDGARILGPQENAPNYGAAVQGPRVRIMQAPQVAQAPQPQLGEVAQVAWSGGRIRRLPQAAAATLYKCPTGTELAVTKRTGTWAAILMSDRSIGWIPTRYLKFTGASVDVSSAVLEQADVPRPNDRAFALQGNWNSDNPMVSQALTWLGTPYVYGGTGRRGIDCSAMIQNSFRACGYKLPRTAAQQARVGMPVDVDHLQPGDRLYFSGSGTRIDHTGLYMGGGKFVHASGRGRAVIVSNLTDARNWNIFVCARR